MRKLLIWDGDETLWRGTILEGDRVALAPGREALCRQLAERGVLQSIASYNREEDILRVLHEVGLDDIFLHNRATLDREGTPKSALVREIVAAYDLSRMSDVAFVDDDPVNRGEVAASLPEVAVVAPDQADRLVDDHFTSAHYTDEDRLRVARYRSESARTVARSKTTDHLTFLRSCDMRMTLSQLIERADEAGWRRVEQLIERANRTAALHPSIAGRGARGLIDFGAEIWVARVSDRYGDYGLSGLIGIALDQRPPIAAALVISCRLQGRGVGSALIGWAIERALASTSQAPRATWVETPYNAGVKQLWEWHGYEALSTELPDGRVRFDAMMTQQGDQSSMPARRERVPDWIALTVESGGGEA